MRNMIVISALSLLVSLPSYAGKAALVKLIKGEAKAIVNGKEVSLKADDWVDGGAVIKTSEKSFVKLVFIDKSQMNVGPLSEIKIEKFHSKDAGVIDLVKGKIRSQVSKDYLQIQGKDRSKLFIKTKNAVMGIRGTDFMISTNGTNTAAILFEGEVVFNRLSDHKLVDSAKLDQIVDAGVRMFPGEFSAVGEQGAPTVPALLNVHQRERLEKNVQFDKNNHSDAKVAKSVVPAGLSGTAVSSKPNIETAKSDESKARASAVADSYVKEGHIKPVNGSFVHIDSATIIAPGADAVLDENSNTYIASDKAGSVNADGSYNPPKGINISDDGKILISADGKVAAKEIAPNSLPIVMVNQNPADQSQKLDIQIGDVANDFKEVTKAGTTTTTPGTTDGFNPTATPPNLDGNSDPIPTPPTPQTTDDGGAAAAPAPAPVAPAGTTTGGLLNQVIGGATGAVGRLIGH
jgi:hypothetical protein